jgi:hypothetical protein
MTEIDMRNLTVAFLAALSLCSGCTPTLHSLFTRENLVFDEQLIAKWTTTDAAVWEIRPLDKQSGRYSLVATMKNQPPAQFSASLGEVNKVRFLELTPKRPDTIHAKTFYGGHFLSLRTFWKVSLADSKLTLTPLSSTWVESMVKQDKLKIKFEKPEGGMLFLTASTEELQQFVTKYANDPGAFPVKGDEKGLQFTRTTK